MSEARGSKRLLPVTPNYRGRPVGVWLGAAFVGTVLASVGGSELAHLVVHGRAGAHAGETGWMLAGCAAVFLAGLYDDFRPARTRGLASQLGALARGRITSGVVKLVAIGLAAAAVTWGLGARGERFVVGAAVVAGSANVWNLLDVRPGRALKFFLPAAAALTVLAPAGAYPALGATAFGAGAVALAADLREWAMLGDGGANVLGFIVGLGLFFVLTPAQLVVALAAILAVHGASETVTLSRLIEGAPVLRWFDDVGRVRSPDDQGSTSS
jgi:hypothetical protein